MDELRITGEGFEKWLDLSEGAVEHHMRNAEQRADDVAMQPICDHRLTTAEQLAPSLQPPLR